jgi:polysaccharide deacetylase family protein (PEP-CTERM system associated)
MKNILTIDMEDWYQGIELSHCDWSKCEDRLSRGTSLLLDILDDRHTSATFFVLGYIAEKFPEMVRKIAEMGHEIGTHGYGHELLYKLRPEKFVLDLKRSINCLEQIVGNEIKIHRAPYFSITPESLWVMNILVENGIEYDSSIFPISNYRYGIPDSPRHPYSIKTKSGSLMELPISTVNFCGKNISLTGGFYLRFFPYSLIKWAIKRINDEGHPAIVYLHPWELDPYHPRINLPFRIKFPHYYNLGSTEVKLRTLLNDFEFGPVRDVIITNDANITNTTNHLYDLSHL